MKEHFTAPLGLLLSAAIIYGLFVNEGFMLNVSLAFVWLCAVVGTLGGIAALSDTDEAEVICYRAPPDVKHGLSEMICVREIVNGDES